MADNDREYRKAIARELLSANQEPLDFELKPDPASLAAVQALAADLQIPFPANLKPQPSAIDPAPNPTDPLPKADVLVVTWTVDEVRALADVLTPGFVREKWYRYSRRWSTDYDAEVRRGAPSKAKGFMGSYLRTQIGATKVLCFKSELHLNQDGVRTGDGTATLPVKKLFHQMIDEVAPKLVITTGTAGGVSAAHDLGDVVVTRGAQFRLDDEFKKEAFNGKKYTSTWNVPTARLADAVALMGRFANRLVEHAILPPTVNYAPLNNVHKPTRSNAPDVKLDGVDPTMPAFHPILTTDFFEFGTSANGLDTIGCAVEMGDAVLGLAVEERKNSGKSTPNWLVIRNCSDPQINGDLYHAKGNTKQSHQVMWAIYYYKGYGYWTSVMSALATWGVIAGL